MAKIELEGLSVQELNDELETIQKHYYALKFNNAASSLENTAEIKNVRIGKHITLEIEAKNKDIAIEKITEACKKLLANQIMESYEFTISEI